MVAFTPIVQADFGNTPMGQAPAAWTDITRFVRLKASPVRVTRWRTDELSTVAPSTITMLLDNADLPGDATAPNAGRFTPGNASSPWASGIVPGLRVRVGVIVGGTTYWRFDGYTDPLEAAFEDGDFSVASLAAQDWLAWAGQQPLRSMLEETILHGAATPLLYLPLTDAAGTTTPLMLLSPAGLVPSIQLVSNLVPQTGAVAFAGGTGPAADDSSAVTFTAAALNAPGILRVDGAIPYAGQARAYLRVNVTTTATVGALLYLANFKNLTGTGGYPSLFINLDGSGHASMGAVDNAGTSTSVAGTKLINDGKPHDIVAEYISGGALNLYVDGIRDGTAAGINLANFPTTYTTLMMGGFFTGVSTWSAGLVGSLSQAAVYFTGSAVSAADQYNAGASGYAGEATGTHISRLLGFRTNNGSVLDAGQGTVGLHRTRGVTLAQALLDVAKSEGGIVYVDGQGRVVFLDRKRLRDPSVSATLDITAQQTTSDLTYRLDMQLLRNDVTISRDTGGSYRAQDATSQNGPAGVRSLSDTFLLNSDDAVKQAASFILANQKTASPASPSVAHDVLTEPTQSVATAVLNLTPFQRVSLINPPTGSPTVDVLTQGSTDTIGVDQFTVSFNTSKLPRQTLRFDATADSFTKLDSGNVFAW